MLDGSQRLSRDFRALLERQALRPAIDVLTGFLDDRASARTTDGVAIDRRGALLVADDVGNVIWRVTASGPVVRR